MFTRGKWLYTVTGKRTLQQTQYTPTATATAASIEFPARTREEDFLVSMATRPLRRKYLSLPRPSRLSAAEEIEGIFHEDGVPPGHFLVTESVAALENRVTHLP